MKDKMTLDVENIVSVSSGESTPRLQERRNAVAHILEGYSVSDLVNVYNSAEDISRVFIPIPSPCKSMDDLHNSTEEDSHQKKKCHRLRERRNAVSFDSASVLLASAALIQKQAQNPSASTT